MPPTSHRRLTRALKVTIASALLAAIVVLCQPDNDHPPERIVTQSSAVTTIPRYAGPTTDTWHELGVALKRAQLAAFFDWASHQPPPTTISYAAPTPTRAKEVAPVASGDARAAIAAHFGDIYDQAVRVADCESGLDPASGPSRTGDYGLFQLHRAAHRDSFEAVTGVPFDEGWSDPNLNALFARWLYDQSGGWGPWSCRWAAHG